MKSTSWIWSFKMNNKLFSIKYIHSVFLEKLSRTVIISLKDPQVMLVSFFWQCFCWRSLCSSLLISAPLTTETCTTVLWLRSLFIALPVDSFLSSTLLLLLKSSLFICLTSICVFSPLGASVGPTLPLTLGQSKNVFFFFFLPNIISLIFHSPSSLSLQSPY